MEVPANRPPMIGNDITLAVIAGIKRALTQRRALMLQAAHRSRRLQQRVQLTPAPKD